MVIDADAHVVEPWDMWEERIDPSMRRQAPRRAPDSWGMDRLLVESRLLPVPEGRGRAPRRVMSEAELAGYRANITLSQDVNARIRRMDDEGIDTAVLLPSQGLAVGAVRDPELATAMAMAYNDWVREHCAQSAGRLVPVAIVPRQDAAMAVDVVRRAHESGFRAVLMGPNPVLGRTLDDRYHYPVWREIERRGLAVIVHEGTGFAPGATAGVDRFESGICSHLISHPVEQMLAVTSLVLGGVLANFPRLRIGFMEAGCGWLPYWLDRMDAHHRELGWEVPWLTMPPSEYFRRQCFVSCEAQDPFVGAVIERVGAEVLLFSTDFPHADHSMTGSVKAVRAREDIPADALDGILGGNCLRLLGTEEAR
ncbi:amidohydrolase family protein [Streptomyces sp. Isolate_45]|uniref:amidohydrolase family protein n=1 Tax=Streptomyces sp. Isolate_45 TaxID=2950111 RepID=UPI002481FEA5|nr:amidohydrolase family protein [Streptomyces sp. Isolate_45]MDA5279823.1 amidohydrolase family protein [Streptomyces sp. Isolate_45]